MDDIVNSVPSWMFTAIIAVCILFIIGIIFARLYRRASAEQAFVRTGLGGQKVVMSGGAIVMPIFHEIIPINMNTLKLEVSRSTIDSLITKDRMRVDVVVAFFVRVKPSVEGIATAAQTLGQRTLSPEDLRMLVEDKFVDALRATAAQMTMHELQDTRENFVQGVQNSCNPVFMELGERLGAENFAGYFKQFGLLSKTNIDLPGEAGTIMHKTENIGPVELATISFGQSFQITPIQLVTTVSSIINGGTRVTPHFGVSVQDADGNTVKTFSYETHENICTAETSETMRYLLEKVVSEGTGKNAKIEGFSIGGKTATSQTLPRSDHKYISSFLGFAPADNPQVLVLVVINNPQGIYYGGTIAAPVAKEIFENILPYLDK